MTEPADRAAFLGAMRTLSGGCSIITAGQGDDRSGLVLTTANSLSADPPMMLACVNHASSTWPLIEKHGRFGWSTLGAGHRAVAERFSGIGGHKGADRYDGADWRISDAGTYLLRDAPAAFDCEVEEMIVRATHSIVIGRVVEVHTTDGAGTLVYWNRDYIPLS